MADGNSLPTGARIGTTLFRLKQSRSAGTVSRPFHYTALGHMESARWTWNVLEPGRDGAEILAVRGAGRLERPCAIRSLVCLARHRDGTAWRFIRVSAVAHKASLPVMDHVRSPGRRPADPERRHLRIMSTIAATLCPIKDIQHRVKRC